MASTFSDTLSVTAVFDEAAKAERAIAWLRNIGLQASQIRQSAEFGAGPAEEAAAPAPARRRRSFVDSLVNLVLPDDAPKAAGRGLSGDGPRRVTVVNLAETMRAAVVGILGDEGRVEEPAPEAPAAPAPAVPVPAAPVPAPPAGAVPTGAIPAGADLSKAGQIQGLLGACLVDCASGRMLGAVGGSDGLDLEVVAALNADFLRTWQRTVEQLDLAAEDMDPDEILLTLDTQVHLFRPLERHRSTVLYVVLDRAVSNLGMARLQLRTLESALATA